MEDAQPSQQVAVRLPPELYKKILEHQEAAEKLTGFKPSLSEVIRKMIEEAPELKRRR